MRRPIFRRHNPWPRILVYLVLAAWLVYASVAYACDPYSMDTPLIVWGGLLIGGVTVVGLLIGSIMEI